MQALQDENLALKCALQEMSRLALPSELAAEQPSQVIQRHSDLMLFLEHRYSKVGCHMQHILTLSVEPNVGSLQAVQNDSTLDSS